MKKDVLPMRVFDFMTEKNSSFVRKKCVKIGDKELDKEQLYNVVSRMSCALLSKDIHRGDVVAMVGTVGYKAFIVELAAMMCGAVVMKTKDDLAAETYVSAFNDMTVKAIVFANDEVFSRFRLLIPQMPSVNRFFMLVSDSEQGDIVRAYKEVDEQKWEVVLTDNMAHISQDERCIIDMKEGMPIMTISHKDMIKNLVEGDSDNDPLCELFHHRYAVFNEKDCFAVGKQKDGGVIVKGLQSLLNLF